MGKHGTQPAPCSRCGGNGVILVAEFDPKEKRTKMVQRTCPACHGRG